MGSGHFSLNSPRCHETSIEPACRLRCAVASRAYRARGGLPYARVPSAKSSPSLDSVYWRHRSKSETTMLPYGVRAIQAQRSETQVVAAKRKSRRSSTRTHAFIKASISEAMMATLITFQIAPLRASIDDRNLIEAEKKTAGGEERRQPSWMSDRLEERSATEIATAWLTPP